MPIFIEVHSPHQVAGVFSRVSVGDSDTGTWIQERMKEAETKIWETDSRDQNGGSDLIFSVCWFLFGGVVLVVVLVFYIAFVSLGD